VSDLHAFLNGKEINGKEATRVGLVAAENARSKSNAVRLNIAWDRQ
jgi:hypothetical protein